MTSRDQDELLSQLDPRLSAIYIAENSDHVMIGPEGVARVAEMYMANGMEFWLWGANELTPRLDDREKYKHVHKHNRLSVEEIIDWIFFVDLMNFNFWSFSGENVFKVEIDGQSYTGYMSLLACVARALDEGIPLISPDYFSKMGQDEVNYVFRGSSGEMSLLETRRRILNESGKILLERFKTNHFSSVIAQAGKSSLRLRHMIVESFPSFNDTAEFKGVTVAFYKRVQILIADIYTCLRGESYGEFHDIDQLTMFADYRVPQALAFLGVIQYSDDLSDKMKREDELSSETECEIRGCSIRAVDMVYDQILAKIGASNRKKNCIPIFIDYFLWHFAKENNIAEIPIHRVNSYFY